MKRKSKHVEVLGKITGDQLIASVGIATLTISRIMESTDPNEWYSRFQQCYMELLTVSEVLAALHEQHENVLARLVVVLPPHLGALVVPNPFYKDVDSSTKPSEEGDVSGKGVDNNPNSDLPF